MPSNNNNKCVKCKKKKVHLPSYTVSTSLSSNERYHYPSNRVSTTKYTALTFLPRFFYEQFRRLYNLYFLVACIITCIPGVSPISPMSMILPFLMILFVAAVKEMYEDFKRWQSDKEFNHRTYEILQGGNFEIVLSKDIVAGNIIHLVEDQEVPADIVLFSSSEKDGICYVDTANLDGETNLKLFKSLSQTASYTEEQIKKLHAVIHAQLPNEKLYDFKGNVMIRTEIEIQQEEHKQDHHQQHHQDKNKDDEDKDDKDVKDDKDDKVEVKEDKKDKDKDKDEDKNKNKDEGKDKDREDKEDKEDKDKDHMDHPHDELQDTKYHKIQQEHKFDVGHEDQEEGHHDQYSDHFELQVIKSHKDQKDHKDHHQDHPGGDGDDDDDDDDENEGLPLGKQQLLMRGTRIRNTKHVYGVVVYLGKETKLSLNAVAPPSKFSETERFVNFSVLIIFIIYILLVAICTIISSEVENGTVWYIPVSDLPMDAGIVFMCYFVLLGNFIPISVFVNLEVLKLIQAGWMISDNDFKVNGQGMKVRNSSLNDELSKVSYIFSDKTGTLTQNKMVFDQCSINGVKYPEAGKGSLRPLIASDKHVVDFLLNMALNNEVIPNSEKTSGGMPKYAAPSPDEIALVKGAYVNGVEFISRSNEGIKIRFQLDQHVVEEMYEILNTFEFSSERKRSSTIVHTPKGNIIMYTKGADSIMEPRLREGKTINKTKQHLTKYSKVGLRALIFTKKKIPQEEYKAFAKKYATASSSLVNREEKLAAIMDEMERDLDLIGCSAIQDALQEEVPSTIAYLIRAGIKVWMITGDQQDTAENIGHSCQLITRESELVRVVKCANKETCQEALQAALKIAKEKQPKVSLVIDGQSLVYAIRDDLKKDLLDVGSICETVIVCRADPLQKALVVRMMKQGTKKICLSIGDGANDVSMLQEAHIGVGIWGEEGSQAANNSDYAIRLFKHLAKLVTVHGRYNVLRTGLMVEYSFYKNIAVFLAQFWFAIFCMWSGQSFYDDWAIAAFNVVIVALPPLALAIFDKDLNEEVILEHAEIYRELRDGLYLTNLTFLRWIGSAFYHSFVIFFSIFMVPDIIYDGNTLEFLVLSSLILSAGTSTVLTKASLATHHWVFYSHLSIWLSYLALVVILLVESSIIDLFPNFYAVMYHTISLVSYWFIIVIVIVISNLPDLIFDFVQRQYFPYNWQIVQEVSITSEESNKKNNRT